MHSKPSCISMLSSRVCPLFTILFSLFSGFHIAVLLACLYEAVGTYLDCTTSRGYCAENLRCTILLGAMDEKCGRYTGKCIHEHSEIAIPLEHIHLLSLIEYRQLCLFRICVIRIFV